ncbi:MAG: diguanylate cyclase domain-containing protein [Methylophilus sp.]
MPYINQQQVVESSQLSRLNSLSVRTVFANVLLALLLAFIQRSAFNPQAIMIWLMLMMLFSLTRIVISQYFIKHPAINSTQTHKRLIIHRVGVVITSAVWGANAFLVLGANQLEQQLFLIYMLSGLSAGAAVSYTVDRICALAYVYFAVVPMIISFLILGGEIPYAMSIAGLVYVVFITYSVFKFNQSLIESIVLRHEADEREEKIKQMAFYDALTNLPNRRLLLDRLEHALLVSKRMEKGGAILFIDINNFKKLNDTLGHHAGDLLLKQVAERLTESVRESDTVARLGGDEFVIMIENLNHAYDQAKNEVDLIVNEMLENLNRPFNLEGTEYYCTVSMGLAIFGKHGNTYQALLKRADIAMYQAKKSGRSAVRMFDSEMKKVSN